MLPTGSVPFSFVASERILLTGLLASEDWYNMTTNQTPWNS